MSHDMYTNVYLLRFGANAMLFQLPPFVAHSVYRNHVQPRIPNTLKEARRKFQRRKVLKMHRAGGAQYSSQPEQIERKAQSVRGMVQGVVRYILGACRKRS